MYQLFFNELKLIQHLKSMKRYFFLENGDFVSYFMEAAESTLSQNFRSIPNDKIQSLLDISLSSSSANHDPFKDNLQVLFDPVPLSDKVKDLKKIQGISISNEQSTQQQTGIQTLSLTFNVHY